MPAATAQTSDCFAQTDTTEASGPQLFDIGLDDRMEEDLLLNLRAALDAQDVATRQQQLIIAAIVAKHLGEEVAAQQAFAHPIASSSAATTALAARPMSETSTDP